MSGSAFAIDESDLVLLVLDASVPPSADDEAIARRTAKKAKIAVLNKIDLPEAKRRAVYGQVLPETECAEISCMTGEGLDVLKGRISEHIRCGSGEVSEERWVFSVRQAGLFLQARESLVSAVGSLESGVSLECAASDIRVAMNAFGEIVGTVYTEDILDRIFDQFCIGK